MLCAICISMFQDPDDEGDHHASFDDLVKAAQDGCKICKILLTSREKLGPDEEGEQEVDPFITFLRRRRECSIQFHADCSWFQDQDLFRAIEYHVSDPECTPKWWNEADKFPCRHIPSNTGDTEVTQIALEWMNDCIANHECQTIDETRDSKYVPSRLVKTSKGEPLTCSLIDLTDQSYKDELLSNGVRYVALSHCWGVNPLAITKLTTDNIGSMIKDIPLNKIPKGFGEALQTCQRLGLEYIWIDSLCIMQSGSGSEKDWQHHAGIMDKICANCTLNIAVSHASDSHQGCFVQRDSDFLQTAYVYAPTSISPENLGSSSDTESLDSSHEESPDPDAMSCLLTIFSAAYDFQSSLYLQRPLQKRGWVYQERIMAPRTLHFGRDRIFWECFEQYLSEYLPQNPNKIGIRSTSRRIMSFNLPEEVLESDPALHLDQRTISNLELIWWDCVHWYSMRELTYPEKDKLMALCALAKRFGPVFPAKYAAGLFLCDNAYQLLWTMLGLTYTRTCEKDLEEHITIDTGRDVVYRAPSWSWASVDDQVSGMWTSGRIYDSRQKTRSHGTGPFMLAEVKNVPIELVNPENPYGQVLSAEIIVNGPLLPLPLLREQDLTRPDLWNKAPERYHEGKDLFVLYIYENFELEKEGDISALYGVVLNMVDPGTYRRVGSILSKGSEGVDLEFRKLDTVDVRIV